MCSEASLAFDGLARLGLLVSERGEPRLPAAPSWPIQPLRRRVWTAGLMTLSGRRLASSPEACPCIGYGSDV